MNNNFGLWCPRTDSNRGPIDYKSIALPAELQGHDLYGHLFSTKDYISQYKNRSLSCSQLKLLAGLVAEYRPIVSDLSAWESV